MKEFLKLNFDKILLSFLFLFTLFLTLHAVRALVYFAEPSRLQALTGTVNWLQNTVGQILASLLTLMVGKGLQQRASDLLNGKTPVPPPADGGTNGTKTVS